MTKETKTSEAEILEARAEALKRKYLEPIAEACRHKFCDVKDPHENFKNHLLSISFADPTLAPTPEKIEEVIAAGELQGFIDLLAPLKFFDLMEVDRGRNLQVISPQDLESLQKESAKSFYKVTFGKDSKPIITPLDNDKIWDKQSGMDITKPFVLINPANGPTNRRTQLAVSEEEFQKSVISETRVFHKAMTTIGVTEERQYLVAVNETQGSVNLALIKEHNEQPDGFITPYMKEQARLIYGPLIARNGIAPDGSGVPFSDEEIIENLKKARNFNVSFGTVAASCQTNALAQMMRDLKISEETIKEAIENMRRVDGSNVGIISKNGIFPSTVVVQASNDTFAQEYGALVPALSKDFDIMEIVPIKDHIIKVYQKVPEEVYHPAKKPTAEEKAQEEKIVRGLPKVKTLNEISALREGQPKLAKVARNILAKSKAKASFPDREKAILEELKLDGLRFPKEPEAHSLPHLTMEATPTNEVAGRDSNLLYKVMADMVTREKSRDVHHFEDQKEPMDTKQDGNLKRKFDETPSSSVQGARAQKPDKSEDKGGIPH